MTGAITVSAAADAVAQSIYFATCAEARRVYVAGRTQVSRIYYAAYMESWRAALPHLPEESPRPWLRDALDARAKRMEDRMDEMRQSS